jgi:hypothetical protein
MRPASRIRIPGSFGSPLTFYVVTLCAALSLLLLTPPHPSPPYLPALPNHQHPPTPPSEGLRSVAPSFHAFDAQRESHIPAQLFSCPGNLPSLRILWILDPFPRPVTFHTLRVSRHRSSGKSLTRYEIRDHCPIPVSQTRGNIAP